MKKSTFTLVALSLGLLLTVDNVSQAGHLPGNSFEEHLVARWAFDDNNGGTTAVSTTNSPADDGTLNGPGIGFSSTDLAPIAGNVSVLDLNGQVGSYVSTDYPGIIHQNARTVSAWVKTTQVGGSALGGANPNGFSIVSWGGPRGASKRRFGIRLDGGSVRIEHNQGYRVGSIFAATGEWTHIAVTMAQGNTNLVNVKIYVDGVEDTVNSATGEQYNRPGIWTFPGFFEIGGLNLFGNNWANGLIDDVRVYDTELNAAEIMVLATPIPEPGSLSLGLLGVVGFALCRRKTRFGQTCFCGLL